jgi:hypothetical protein
MHRLAKNSSTATTQNKDGSSTWTLQFPSSSPPSKTVHLRDENKWQAEPTIHTITHHLSIPHIGIQYFSLIAMRVYKKI